FQVVGVGLRRSGPGWSGSGTGRRWSTRRRRGTAPGSLRRRPLRRSRRGAGSLRGSWRSPGSVYGLGFLSSGGGVLLPSLVMFSSKTLLVCKAISQNRFQRVIGGAPGTKGGLGAVPQGRSGPLPAVGER